METASLSQPTAIPLRGTSQVEAASRARSVSARNRFPHRGRTASRLYQRVRGLASEFWQISRWLLLKSLAFTMYSLRGRTERCERRVIRLGNAIFRRRFPNELFADFESYASRSGCDLQQYFALLPVDEWLVGKDVLDVGSGLGQYSHALASRGARRVVGLEYQAEKARWAAAKYRSNQVEFRIGTATRMPFPGASFDTVFSHTVFEHIDDVPAALREVRRVLKPNGIALLSFNFFHHRGGHHLFPYIHFPWATWAVSEPTLCKFWSEQLARDQQAGGMQFYPAGSHLDSLSDGAEIHLNKLTFDEFEAMLPGAGLEIVRRRSSEEVVHLLPWLARVPKIRNFLTGSVYYVLKVAD